MMDSIKLQSPAKINWLLRVGGTRADGFHDLSSVMQTLALADEITLSRRDDNECMLSGFPPDIDPDKNLVTKAWRAMQLAFPGQIGGVHIAINKRLPRGGGLGGGSSNAGVVIRGLAKLFSLKNADLRGLTQIASTVGSDVPFFIHGGLALVAGRGERVVPLEAAPVFHLVLVFPDVGVSTPEAYRQLDALAGRETALPSDEDLDTVAAVLAGGRAEELAEIIENDFELTVSTQSWYQQARLDLDKAGALKTFLCGSGSTVAGLFADERAATRAAETIGGMATSTLGRG